MRADRTGSRRIAQPNACAQPPRPHGRRPSNPVGPPASFGVPERTMMRLLYPANSVVQPFSRRPACGTPSERGRESRPEWQSQPSLTADFEHRGRRAVRSLRKACCRWYNWVMESVVRNVDQLSPAEEHAVEALVGHRIEKRGQMLLLILDEPAPDQRALGGVNGERGTVPSECRSDWGLPSRA